MVETADGAAYEDGAGAFTFTLTPSVHNPAADPITDPVTVTSSTDGYFSILQNVTYTQAGTYQYLLRENHPKATRPGIVYDDMDYIITVTVTDKGGTLAAVISATDSDGTPVSADALVFRNTYDADTTSVLIEGIKLLQNAELEDDMFSFVLEPVSYKPLENEARAADDLEAPEEADSIENDAEEPEESNAADENALLAIDANPAARTFAAPVEPDVTDADVTEEQDAAADTAPSASAEDAEESEQPEGTPAEPEMAPEEAEDTLADDAQETAEPEDATSAVPSEPVDDLEVHPRVAMLPSEMPVPASATVGNTAFGTFHFGRIEFDTPGIYTYLVREKDGGLDGYTYDQTVYVVQITVEKNASGELVSQVELLDMSSNAADALTFRNTAPKPQISIEKTQRVGDSEHTKDPLTVSAGNIVTYALTVTNTSDSVAADVIIRDPVPNGLTVVDGSLSDGGTVTSDGILHWNVGDLDPGASATVTFQATVPQTSGASSWTNQASVSLGSGPQRPSNAVVINTGGPNVTLEKDQMFTAQGSYTTDILHGSAGATVRYRLTVRNTGAEDALDVRVADTVPSGLTVNTASISDGGTYSNGVVYWSIGTLRPGESKSLTFDATLPASVSSYTIWTNVGTVTYANNPANPDGGLAPIHSNQVQVDVNVTSSPTTNYGSYGYGSTPSYPAGTDTSTGTALAGNAPKTDDQTALDLWWLLALLSAAALVFSTTQLTNAVRRR